MDRLRSWLLPIGVLVIVAAVGVALIVVVSQTTRPVSALTGQLATQVAGILHPTPTVRPDPVTIVREVRGLARLETIQYTLEKVVTAETGQGTLGFLFGDRLLFVAHGVVTAGVDLEQMRPEDLRIDDQGRVYLRLPNPEVFVATLDNDKSYVYDRQTGLLRRGDIQLEAEARRAAEDEMRKAALEDGILEQARLNAENVIGRFLRSLGFADVIFERETEATPTPAAP
jgi:hypothetical protein